MSTPHVLHLLPLWAGGDLSRAESEAVQAHLGNCPNCRAEAEALASTLALLKEAPLAPFSESDRAVLRASVMEQIRREAPRPLRRTAWLWAAAALMLAVASPFLLRHPALPAIPVTAPEADRAPLVTPKPVPAGPGMPRSRPLARRTPPAVESSSPDPTLTRIEFQTSNPNIRIIWLAKATMPEPTALNE